ncbi:uncharacterized protein LOC133321947 [Musca vetustissima]|uniref:uncharacterized protein LOC133321947 n=1 Tax=Musca vetustissima TaxID=27455 RepID=UPI002AB607C4|nr:uncharacterized protein LOC133321947 [Musca vetustissima]
MEHSMGTEALVAVAAAAAAAAFQAASTAGNASLSYSEFANERTRKRTTFDPDVELPQLQQWFQENPHPTRQQMQAYVMQLNALGSRRGSKPLDLKNVIYWFKNARAALKRAEMRGGFDGTQGGDSCVSGCSGGDSSGGDSNVGGCSGGDSGVGGCSGGCSSSGGSAAGMQANSTMYGDDLTDFSNEERRKRDRTLFDPVTEVPKMEHWFAINAHPSHSLILKYTDDLNKMPYRQKFPHLQTKNVQLWFKNHRAKCKRQNLSL